MEKSSRTMGSLFQKLFRKCQQKSKIYFSEPNDNLKKLKKSVTVARIEKSRCKQRLKANGECRAEELSRSLIENVSRECGKSFKSAMHTGKHISSNNSGKTLKCKFCSKSFRHHSNLKMHNRIHLKDESFPEDESLLNRHFINYSLRKRTASNTGLNAYKLNDNPKKQFSSNPKYKPVLHRTSVKAIKQKIKSKMRIVMQKENTHSCSMCKKLFKRKDHLKQHVIIHTEDRPFSCGMCQKLFKRKDHLKRHSVTHTEDKPFSCSTCEKTFRRKQHLQRHFHIHLSDEPFFCYKCMKGFKQKNHLTLHNRIHSKGQTFSCKKCGKIFKKEIGLQRHFLIHSRKNVFAKNRQRRKFRGKMDMKKCFDSNKEDNASEPKVCKEMSMVKDQTKYNFSDNNRDDSISREICDKDFTNKYDLDISACTRSKSSSYDCCTPYAIQKDNIQLEEQVCADTAENVLTDNTHSEQKTMSLQRHFLVHSRKNVFVKNRQRRKFQGKIDMKKCFDSNKEDNAFEPKDSKEMSVVKDQTKYDSSDNNRDDTISREICDKDFEKKYDLGISARTRSKSSSYDCCTPYAIQKDNRQLEEQIYADTAENVLIDNTRSEQKAMSLQRHFLVHSRKNVFAKNRQRRKFRGKMNMKKCFDSNKEDNAFELKDCEEMSRVKGQTKYDSSGNNRDDSISREICDKDFTNKYDLDIPVCTPSKSSSYDCCTPYAIQKDNRELDEQVCADTAENVLTDSTHSEQKTMSEIMIDINTDKEDNSRDSCDSETKNPNCTEENHMKITDIFECSVTCSYCGKKFKRHGDLQRHLRVHRLSLKDRNIFEVLNKFSFLHI